MQPRQTLSEKLGRSSQAIANTLRLDVSSPKIFKGLCDAQIFATSNQWIGYVLLHCRIALGSTWKVTTN